MAISQYALAKAIGVPPRRINEIVKGLRLSVFFGTDAQSWVNLQTHYDTEHACVAMADVLGRIVRRELADDHHETPNARAKLAPTAW
jgi:plasmid maintenance system antidote protein VapI